MSGETRRVLLPVADGVEELEAVAVVDILRRAGCEVVVASVGGMEVTGRNGMKIVADASLAAAVEAPFEEKEEEGKRGWDFVVIPGGGAGVERLRGEPALRRLLQRQAQAHRGVAAICAGPLLLADAGILEGRRATCHRSVEGDLGNVRLVQLPVVEDGFVVTSRGPGTAVEFALRLVRRLAGPQVEEEIRRQIHAS